MSEKEVLNSVDIAIVALYFVAILGIGIKVYNILFIIFCSVYLSHMASFYSKYNKDS